MSALKDAWWLLGVLTALLAFVWRMAVKTNKALEQVERVKGNSEKIETLGKEVDSLKRTAEQTNRSVRELKGDIIALTSAMLSVVDELRSISESPELTNAQKRLRDHLINS